ncbi:MAG: radical SAM protein [Desulfovibrio sp.]|nr:radical SAM protein [Desulfovibrio sp.]
MLIRRTQSLCPVCLRRIDASYVEENNVVYMRKECTDHGVFQVPIWRNQKDGPTFSSWSRPKTPSYPKNAGTAHHLGCPFDCGLCPEHGQHTCTALVEITNRCNLHCPVCYANANIYSQDPPLSDIARRFATIKKYSGSCNLQLSGGEPTVREDLIDIIALAKQHNFALIQLNTNGLRLGTEVGYAQKLAQAGLESVYLQWDGVREETFQHLRGQACLDFKHKALKACAQAGLGIVLVATVVAGINDTELGDLLRFAINAGDCVRGLHLQPAAYFGRYPYPLLSAPRLTLVEVLTLLTQQSQNLILPHHMHPPACEHELCSFSAVFSRTDSGLTPINVHDCCSTTPIDASYGASVSKQFTALHWKAPQKNDAFSRFLSKAGLSKRFTISCMAFQDALSVDVARVRGCCIHVVRSDGRMLPFCLHNLTAEDGTKLYD